MRQLGKLGLALGLVLLVIPLGVALRGPNALVEMAKGRPFVPVVREQQAQDDQVKALALADARVTDHLGADRWEFVDTLAMSGYLPGALAACAGKACRQGEFFNFTTNTLVVATVNLTDANVVDVQAYQDAWPEANRTITERAQAIALADPAVKAEIGDATIVANMAPENAWLRNSSCDTPHWCIALTYRVDGKDSTLVTFVDLNTEQVAGVRWSVAPPVPEQNLPVYKTPNYACGDQLSYTQNGWSFQYEVQSNDALHVYNITFNGRPVFQSAKMTQVDVGYANQSWGYHDSVGCSGIVPPYPANTAPAITQIADGFVLTQDFRMGGWGGGCAYRYQQWFTFYNDGRVRVSVAAYGRGCGNDGVYTPYVRINIGPGGQAGNSLQLRNAQGAWAVPSNDVERDYEQPTSWTDVGGAYWRVLGADQAGFDIEPRWGENMEPGQADSGDAIMLAFHSGAEGDQPNLPSMGSGYGCPNNCFPSRQWVNNESVQNADIVMWYVPSAQTIPVAPYYCWTLSTSQTYPCYMGPMFHPVNLAGMAPNALAKLPAAP
jgi:hypothetical protein